MKWLENWRRNRGAKVFRQRSAKVQFPHAFKDLDLAKRIGFIVNLEELSPEDLAYLVHYLAEMQRMGKEVLVVELNFQRKAMPVFNGKVDSIFIGNAHKNLFGLPSIKKMQELNKSKLDILVNLDRSEWNTGTYICGLSNASMRVGLHKPDLEDYFELMLQLPAETKIQKVLAHFEHYSNMLQK